MRRRGIEHLIEVLLTHEMAPLLTAVIGVTRERMDIEYTMEALRIGASPFKDSMQAGSSGEFGSGSSLDEYL
jgi:hypothetical protein